MIVEFSCSNVRSIKEPVTFSLEASVDKSLRKNLIHENSTKMNYLRFAEILGENGSGKTSILIGLSLLMDLILRNTSLLHGQPLVRIPHKTIIDKPTFFSIKFIRNGTLYKYMVEYDNNTILNESLYYWPSNRIALIFKREGEKYEVSAKFPRLGQAAKAKLDSNKLLFVIGSQNTPYEELKNAISFFTTDIVLYSPGANNWLDYSAEHIEKNPELHRKVLDFLHSLGINAKKINAHVEQRLLHPEEIPLGLISEQFRQAAMNQMAIFSHIDVDYGGFSVDYNEESAGIKSLLRFLCPLFDILEQGKVFICDEIETQLHPSAVRKIIELFSQNQKSQAQIILTTHDTGLLDLDLLRRDQIWFSSMDRESRSSYIFRLSDLNGVRKDDNLKKKFLDGTYREMWKAKCLEEQ